MIPDWKEVFAPHILARGKKYYEDGKVKTSKMFSNNVANGPAVEYYEDGSVKSECTYKNGEVKGRVKVYKAGERRIEN